jgi:murein DD-endopeptidase MepM/ murein hydrolase activator NlpD
MIRVIKKFKFQALLSTVTAISLAINVYLVFFKTDDDIEELASIHDEAFFNEVEIDVPHIVDDVIIGKGISLDSILTGLGATREDAKAVTSAIDKVYPLKRIKSGDKVIFDSIDKTYQGDNERVYLNQFHILTEQNKIDVRLNPQTKNFEVKQIILPLENKLKLVNGQVSGSLYNSIKKAGTDSRVVMELINLFSYSTDFQREIRSGDNFKVLYEYQANHDGKVMTKPKIIYATITTGSGRKEIFRHVLKSGKVEYFDDKGTSMRRALLRTPITSAKISSGFGMRAHPLLGYSKMHQGLDYSAPIGTPVLASGDGVVEFAKNQSHGYGKHIKVKHNGTYATLYAHLSRFAPQVKAGVKVSQGQVIGYVGNTGMTSGAHLHYEVEQNGKKVNPSKVSFPKVPPLKGLELARFQSKMIKTEKVVAELNSMNKTVVAENEIKTKLEN